MAGMESLWDQFSSILDTNVDEWLGDRLRVFHRGVHLGEGDPPTVPGFIVIADAPINLEEIDETLGHRRRVKISIALVDEPLRATRFATPKLGDGWFQPGGGAPENDGRYWIIDVQQASAPL